MSYEPFLAALAVAAAAWLAIGGSLVAGRIGYARVRRSLAKGGAPARRPRSAILYRLMLDGAQPEALRQRAGACLLDARGPQALLRDAAGMGWRSGRWRRIGAWEALHRTGTGELHALLAGALGERDPTLQQAAAAMLGRLRDRRAAEILVAALRDKRYTAECLVMQLHRFDAQTSAGVLAPLFDAPDPSLRFWAISLLGHSGLDALDLRIGAYAADPDAKVRKAVAQAMGEIGSERAFSIASRLLNDRTGFVRAHAVQALHKIGRTRRRSVAALVAPLEDDRDWWVRLAVREVLADAQPRGMQLVDDEASVAPPLRPVAGWLPPRPAGLADTPRT